MTSKTRLLRLPSQSPTKTSLSRGNCEVSGKGPDEEGFRKLIWASITVSMFEVQGCERAAVRWSPLAAPWPVAESARIAWRTSPDCL